MCAAEVIATQGVSGTSLTDVVEAANVSKGALYFHFSSKEELLIGVEELYNVDSRQMIQQVSRDPDPLRRLIRLSLALARRQYRDRLANAHDRLMLSRSAPPMPADLPTLDWAEVLRGWLSDAIEAGHVTADLDLLTASELLDDCLLGVVTASTVEQRAASMIARMAGLWRHLVLPGLVPDATRRAGLLRFVDEQEAWSEAEVRRPLDEEDVSVERYAPPTEATADLTPAGR